ncbi:MAG: hypothetical protein AAGC57_05340 [Pseudomonadota bacterium]
MSVAALQDAAFLRTRLPPLFAMEVLVVAGAAWIAFKGDGDAVRYSLFGLLVVSYAVGFGAHLWVPRRAVILNQDGVLDHRSGVLVPWSAIRGARARRVFLLAPMVELDLARPVKGLRGTTAKLPTLNLETSAPTLAAAIQRHLPCAAPVVH